MAYNIVYTTQNKKMETKYTHNIITFAAANTSHKSMHIALASYLDH